MRVSFALVMVLTSCFTVPTVPSLTGRAGANGTNGKDGAEGATGSTGPTGDAGANGREGDTGATGVVSVTGTNESGATGPSGMPDARPSGLVLRRAQWRGEERFELIWRRVTGAAHYRVELSLGGVKREELVTDAALAITLAPNTGLWTFRVVPVGYGGADGPASDALVFDTALRFHFLSYSHVAGPLQVVSTTTEPFDTQTLIWNDPTRYADGGHAAPDGRSLAFVTWTQQWSSELRVTDLSAGTTRVLRSFSDALWLTPTWSPDSRFIAGQRTSRTSPLDRTIEVLDATTGALVLELARSPSAYFAEAIAWSSDGRFLACTGPDGVTVVDMTTLSLRIVKAASAAAWLSWNPRNSVLAARTSTALVFYDADADLSVERQARVGGAALWSPDGTRAVYVTFDETAAPALHVTSLSGTTDTIVYSPGPGHGIHLGLRWARDSSAVYLVHSAGPPPGLREVLRVAITGGTDTIFSGLGQFRIYGSSAHRYLAMTRYGASGIELVFLDQETGALTTAFTATKSTTNVGDGAWSWDGSRFAASLRGGVDSALGETSAAVLFFSPDAPPLPTPTPLPKNDDLYDAQGWLEPWGD